MSGTRADFGLMVSTLRLAQASGKLDVTVCVTGMHLLHEYGYTVSEVEASGLPVQCRIPVVLDGSSGALMAKALGEEVIGMTNAFCQESPDIVLVLGDRGEMLAATIAAVHLNIAVVHLHGGERSGTIDEPIRHAISKLAHYHFVSTMGARERLIRMGEQAERIFVTGAPGLDRLRESATKGKETLCAETGLDPAKPVALVVFHPVVQEAEEAGRQMEEVIAAVRSCGMQALCLRPNADAGGRAIGKVLDQSVRCSGVCIRIHLSRPDYISWMSVADAMVGNSSSGIIEAATFNLPVINVGSRQLFRERSGNVLDVEPERKAIVSALRQILSRRFVGPWENIYGDGQAGKRIVDLLCRIPLGRDVLHKVNEY